MKKGPVKPDEVGEYQFQTFPQVVFDVFNELIAKDYDGNSATVYQDDAVSLIAQKLNIDRSVVFNKGYVNIEPAYRAAGWKVNYDKPAYCENYRAHFIFKKK